MSRSTRRWKSLFGSSKSSEAARQKARRRREMRKLFMEPLEDRRMLATANVVGGELQIALDPDDSVFIRQTGGDIFVGTASNSGDVFNGTQAVDALSVMGAGGNETVNFEQPTGATSFTVLTNGISTDAAVETVNVDVAISTSGGGTSGDVSLSADTVIMRSGILTDGGDVTISASNVLRFLGGNLTIDTESGDNSDAGDILLAGSAIIDGIVNTSQTYNLRTDTGGGMGGAITLPSGGAIGISTQIYDSRGSGGNNGLIELNGGTFGDFGGEVNFAGDMVLNASVVIATNLNPNEDGGAVDLRNASISAANANTDLTIRTDPTVFNSGAIALGEFNNAAGHYVRNLTLDSENAGSFSDGSITLTDSVQITGTFSSESGTANTLLQGDLTVGGGSVRANEIQLGNVTVTVSGSGALTFWDNVTGSDGLTKAGTGTLVLAAANGYTGATAVDAGILEIGNSASLGGGGTTVASGATLRLNGSNLDITSEPLTISGSGAGGTAGALQNSNSTGAFVGAISLTADTTIHPDQGWIRIGGTTGTGNLTINSGNSHGVFLNTAGGGNLAHTGQVQLAGSGQLDLYNDKQITASVAALLIGGAGSHVRLRGTDNIEDTVSVIIGLGTLELVSGDETIGSLAGAGSVLLNTHTLTTGDSGDDTYSGAISGSGGLVKQGSGTFTLSGASSYSGGTTVSQGELHVGHMNALGTGPVTLGDSNTGSNDVALLATGTFAIDNNITVSSLGSGSVTVGTTEFSSLSSMTFNGTVTLNRDVVLQGGNTDRTTFGNQISGNGNVTISTPFGARRVVFRRASGAANSFGGDLFIQDNAILQLGVATEGMNDRYIPNTADVHFATSTSQLRLASPNTADSETLGALISDVSGAGQIRKITGSATATLTVGANDASGTFSGVISNESGTIAIVKDGAGTQTLSGNNTYSGTTTVDDGTLLVDGTNSGGGAVAVNSGATLGGTGSLGGTVTVNSGGTITAGTIGTVGTLTVGGLSFNGGTYQADLSGTTADRITTAGTVDLDTGTAGSFTLNQLGGATTPTNEFVLIDNTAAGAIVDPPLTGAAEGASTTVDGKNAVYSYLGGDGGNDFTLTVAGNVTYTGTGAPENFQLRVVDNGGNPLVQLLEGVTISVAGGAITVAGGSVVDSRPLGAVDSYTIDAAGGDDQLVIDYAASDDLEDIDITFNGDADSDTLYVRGGTFGAVVYNYANANDGDIENYSDDAATTLQSTITYTGLEPITSTVTATNVTLNYSGASETITVTDAGSGQTNVDSTAGETTTFNNPSGTLTINAGDGPGFLETVNVDSLAADYPANLTIDGQAGYDTVNFNGPISLAADKSLTVQNASVIDFPNTGSDVSLSGNGAATLTADIQVALDAGASLITVNGDISLSGNAAGTAAANASFFGGIVVEGADAIVQSTGSGAITLVGHGSLGADGRHGVRVADGGKVLGGTGDVFVTGTGGSDNGIYQFGVFVTGTGSQISSAGGDVAVIGQGGVSAPIADSLAGEGVVVTLGGEISAGGLGSVSVTGTGGAGIADNQVGVIVVDANSVIKSAGGDVTVIGQGGGSSSGQSDGSAGVVVDIGGEITAGGTGTVSITGTGGPGSGTQNGITVRGTDSKISSSGGNVIVIGQGGGSGLGRGSGVFVGSAGEITAGTAGSVSVTGTGGLGTASAQNGVSVDGTNSRITSNEGDVVVDGLGGSNGDRSQGVLIRNLGQITAGGNGTVTVTGTGGSSSGVDQTGVKLESSGAITSGVGGGDVTVTGVGGASGSSNFSQGVFVLSGGKISGSGSGKVTVTGTGGNGTGSNNNGVLVNGTGSAISSEAGVIDITGTAGNGSGQFGVSLRSGGAVTSVDGEIGISSIDQAGGADHIEVGAGSVVRSDNGTVQLLAGDNLYLRDSSTVEATAGLVTLLGDYGDADPGAGSTMELFGTITSGTKPIIVEGGPDGDTIHVNPDKDLPLEAPPHTIDQIQLDGKGGDDTYLIQLSRLNGDSNAVTIADTGGGVDRATVTATDEAETLTLHDNETNSVSPQTGGSAAVVGTSYSETVHYTETLEYLTVNAKGSADLFYVQPSQTAEISIHGGTPQFGDDLDVVGRDGMDFQPFNQPFQVRGRSFWTQGGSPAAFKPVNIRNLEDVPLRPIGTNDVLRFDFDATTLVTETDYTSVPPAQLYGTGTAGSDFGWVDTAPWVDDRGATTGDFIDLLRDYHFSNTAHTFRADVTNGWYLVSVKIGDLSSTTDQLRVVDKDTGYELLQVDSTISQQVAAPTFVVYVADGTLDLEFSDTGGMDPHWRLNGLEVRPGQIFTIGSPEPGPLESNGFQETTFTGYEATPHALITLAASIDTTGDHIADTAVEILTPDVDPNIDGLQVRAGADRTWQYTLRHPNAPGEAYVSMEEVTGAQTGLLVLDFVPPPTRRFDFNAVGTPTQAPVASAANPDGYIGVSSSDLAGVEVGYGWVTSPIALDRGALSGTTSSDLLRDSHFGTNGTFLVKLTDGPYYVNVTMGDAAAAWSMIDIFAEGSPTPVVDDLATPAGQFVHRSFPVTVTGGELELKFTGGPYFVLNALEIFETVTPHGLSESGGVVTGTANPNALVTVSTDLGSIATADADPFYDGVQVLADGSGNFSFTLTAPSGAGTATVRSEEVTGRGSGSTTVTYTAPAGRKFDFNGYAGVTEPGYTPVSGTQLYDAGAGFGWKTGVWLTDRGAASTAKVALHRDGHQYYGSTWQTFQVAVTTGQPYEVVVHTGDAAIYLDQLEVRIEDGAPAGYTQTAPPTMPNTFTTVVLSGVADQNGDGILDISFRDVGGPSAYWVVNGVEVTEMSPLAPASAGEGGDRISSSELAPVFREAVATWASTGLSASQMASLQTVQYEVRDLAEYGALGLAGSRSVLIDDDGAGYGWRVDTASPYSSLPSSASGLARYDLLTAVMHELGHVLGHDHDDVLDAMAPTLAPEVRQAFLLSPIGSASDRLFDGLGRGLIDDLTDEQSRADELVSSRRESRTTVDSSLLLASSDQAVDQVAYSLLADEEEDDAFDLFFAELAGDEEAAAKLID